MTDFDGKRFMIEVRPLALWKKFFYSNRMAKFDVTVRQTPHVFSDSPGIYIVLNEEVAGTKCQSSGLEVEANFTFKINTSALKAPISTNKVGICVQVNYCKKATDQN